jgi:hypothetical protein
MSLEDDEEEDVYMFAVVTRRDLGPDQFPTVCRIVVIATDVIGRNPLSRNCEIPLTPARTAERSPRVSAKIVMTGWCMVHSRSRSSKRTSMNWCQSWGNSESPFSIIEVESQVGRKRYVILLERSSLDMTVPAFGDVAVAVVVVVGTFVPHPSSSLWTINEMM